VAEEHPVPVIENFGHRVDIRPRDINLEVHLTGFGKSEVEETAAVLVKFFQHRDLWESFRLEDFLRFAEKEGHRRGLFGLIGAWWNSSLALSGVYVTDTFLVAYPDGTVAVTEEFVRRVGQDENRVKVAS
jgi:hypothetical protein